PHREPDAHARHRSHEAGRGVPADRGGRRSLDPGALRLLPPLARRRRPDLGRARDDAPRRRRLSAGRAPDHAAHDRLPALNAPSPRSSRMTTESVLYQGLGMSLEDVLNMEARNQAVAARTPDREGGVCALLEN